MGSLSMGMVCHWGVLMHFGEMKVWMRMKDLVNNLKIFFYDQFGNVLWRLTVCVDMFKDFHLKTWAMFMFWRNKGVSVDVWNLFWRNCDTCVNTFWRKKDVCEHVWRFFSLWGDKKGNKFFILKNKITVIHLLLNLW